MRPVLVLVVPVLVSVSGAATIAAEAGRDEPIANVVFFGLLFFTAALGGVVAARRPDNVTGWLLLVSPLPVALNALAAEVAISGWGSAALVAASANLSLWVAQLGIAAVGSLLLRFPTGHHRSRRWRRYEVVCYLGVAAGILGLAIRPGGVYVAPDVPNPLGVESLRNLAALLEGAGGLAQAALLLGGALSVILRWRRGSPAVRQQIKWVAYALAAVPLFATLGEIAGAIDQSPEDYLSFAFNILGVAFVPASIAVAILRYRLYDIDVVINRTLVYTVLTAVLVGAYALGVLLFRALLDPITGEGDLAIAASTLAVAALFGPARRRIQAFIDRRFYRSRYDAQKTLEAFAARLRDEVDLDAVTRQLREIVVEAMHPARAGIWLAGEGRR